MLMFKRPHLFHHLHGQVPTGFVGHKGTEVLDELAHFAGRRADFSQRCDFVLKEWVVRESAVELEEEREREQVSHSWVIMPPARPSR